MKTYSTGQPIREGDLAFETEGRKKYQYVCTWIQEWGIFAWLGYPGEYGDYKLFGISALDESMKESYGLTEKGFRYITNFKQE